MSPVLFALYLEPLCRTILNDGDITGFSFADTSLKVLAYADDLTLMCASKEEVRQGMQHVMDFCKVSGAKVNCEKCAGAWLGVWDSKPTTFLDVKWTSEINSYLGVCFDTANLQNGQNTIRSDTLAAKVQH